MGKKCLDCANSAHRIVIVNAECYAEYAEYVVGKADECKERMKKA